MTPDTLNRRDFLKLGLATGTAAAVTAAFPRFSMARVKPCTLADCLDMTPEDMAEKSAMVMDAWHYIQQTAASIENPETRRIVQGILNNPAPTFMADLADSHDRNAVYTELTAKGFLKDRSPETFLPPVKNPAKSIHPFIAGPGSGYTSHHAYPGGLVTHTALNTLSSLSLYENYRQIYGYTLDRDTVIASQLMHDLTKPWVYQWQASGESRTELPLAGTGEHHVLAVAESVHRGLLDHICVAQACAHNHPGFADTEQGPVNWIQAAAILLGKNPAKLNLLSDDQTTLPVPRRMENFICHLGDHDWVLAVPSVKWMLPVLEQIAAETYKMSPADISGRKFNQLRNYVASQTGFLGMYEIYSTRGKKALADTLLSMVAPA